MINITLIQTDLVWQNRDANIKRFDELIDSNQEQTDLIVLPEMFTTGFSMKPNDHAETMNGPALDWMIQKASDKKVAITGSMMIQDKDRFYNRLFFVFPDGKYEFYDKRHLFRMADEHNHYTAGSRRIMIPYKGFLIFPIICYDLRFPVWLRRTRDFNYDLLICVANWPERRNAHWKALIQARAIENQCFVAAVNRVGEDGNHINHSGDSALINARGEIIHQVSNDFFMKTFTLDKQETEQYRQSFNVIEDADPFVLT
jgi:predicted amidohydrolase